MIVYSATKGKFHEDVDSNNIGNIILGAFETATHHRTSRSEVDSWTNSLQYMDRVLNDGEIPRDVGVSIEYHIPNTTKRIDLILTGLDGENNDTAVLVELKQWSAASMTNKDAIVVTWLGKGMVERPHPSYQAWTYKRLLEDFNQTVQEEAIRLFPCAYAQNRMIAGGSVNCDASACGVV